MNIILLEGESIQAKFRRPQLPHRWQSYPFTDAAQVLERLQDADIVIVNKLPISATTLAALPRLKLIAVSATGFDNIDLPACRAQGVTVCNMRGYSKQSVPEHTLCLLLALARNVSAYHVDVAAGAWPASRSFCYFGAPIRDLHGRTLVILGRGTLGTRVAELAQAFGMRILFAEQRAAVNVRPGYCSFTEALAQADALSLHCPLNEQTRQLINGGTLAMMKSGALLINTARGGLVDEIALLEALQSGRLGGAALDVLSVEPPPATHPLLQISLPNLLITPHVAWASAESMQTLADMVMDNIDSFMRGEQLANAL